MDEDELEREVGKIQDVGFWGLVRVLPSRGIHSLHE